MSKREQKKMNKRGEKERGTIDNFNIWITPASLAYPKGEDRGETLSIMYDYD